MRGKEILEKELKRHRMDNIMSNSDLMEKITSKLNFMTIDDLYASLGYGETTLPQILTKIRDELPKAVEEVLVPKRPPSKKEKMSLGIRVKGIDNVLVRFSKCCSPVPGDDIIGYITLGKGISIHRRNCPNMPALSMQTERVVDVSWEDKQKGIRYQVEIEIDAWDRHGLLSDVMNVINETKVQATSCNAKVKKSKAQIHLSMDVTDKMQLDDIIKRLSRVKDVISVGRATSQGDYV